MNCKREISNKMLFISATLFVVTMCIFGPIELYIGNKSEFWFRFSDILIISAILCCSCMVIVVGVGLLLPKKIRGIYSALLFGCTLCLYVQGNYLNIDYGLLDGKAVDWASYGTYALLDTACWLIIVGIVLLLWKKKNSLFVSIQKYASVFLIATQVLTLCILIVSGGVLSNDEDEEYYLSAENLYSIGEGENIIILLLDAFDEEYIEEIFDENPDEYKTIFQDFTHYTNMAAGGSPTNSAMPIIITGEHYPGKISYKEYVSNSFNSDHLYTTLKEKGYTVNFYTEDAFVPSNAGEYVANLVHSGYMINSFYGLTAAYAKLTMYKYAPHLLKRYFWFYSSEFDLYRQADEGDYAVYREDDLAFYQRLCEGKLKLTEGKYFSLIHLTGSHPPFNMNEHVQYEEDVSVIEKSKGSLRIVEEYLNQMKELGVYDESTIIVMSDHGQKMLTRSIMLIKKPFASGYSMNDAPISQFDLHNTFFELVGEETGESIFDIEEDAVRTRMYYPQSGENGSFYMTEYTLRGNPKDIGIGEATGVVLSPEKVKNKYKLGTELTFGSDGTSNPYVEKGINGLHIGYAWTDGNEIVFQFPLANAPKKDLEMILDYYTVYLDINDQYLEMYVDDTLLFEEVLTSEEERTIIVDIPAELAQDKELVVRLEMPDAKRPSEVFGPGYDPHMLGLALTGLNIREIDLSATPKYTLGTTLTFGPKTNASPYVQSGISHSATMDFAWTDGPEVLFRIPLEQKLESDLRVVLNTTSIYKEFGSQRVRITANNELCFDEELAEAQDIVFSIPESVIVDNNLALRLYLPNAVSPYKITGDGDRRGLGIAITGLTIEAVE